MVEIKRNNPKAFQVLNLRLKELQAHQAKVGWFETATYEKTGIPVATIAAQNELGNPAKNIPPRPTMRPAFIDTKGKVEKIANNGAKRILEGKSSSYQIMTTIAEVVKGEISRNIATITEPPLAPRTIAARRRRGNNSIKPLNDTGHMLSTLDSVVENANTI